MRGFTTNYYNSTNSIIREYLDSYDMTQKELSLRLGISEKHMSTILNSDVEMTMDIALGLEKIFGLSAKMWIRHDSRYREFCARKKVLDELKKLDTAEVKKQFCIDFLKKKNWIHTEPDDKIEDTIYEVLNFMGVSSLESFIQIYDEKISRHAFKEDGYNVIPLALWIRKCERTVYTKPAITDYSKKTLQRNLEKIKELLILADENIFHKIEELLNDAGVYFVIEEAVPGSKVRAAVTWHKKNPVLQVSMRFKTYDHFWFAFLHEIKHIMEDLNTDNWIIDFDESEKFSIEKTADNFARDFLINPLAYDSFLAKRDFSQSMITTFAEEIKIHPSIVVGRLQHEKRIGYNKFNELKEKIQYLV